MTFHTPTAVINEMQIKMECMQKVQLIHLINLVPTQIRIFFSVSFVIASLRHITRTQKYKKSTMYTAQYTVGGHVRLIARMENSKEDIDIPAGTVFKIIAVPGEDGGVCTILIPARFIPARKYMEMELAAAEEHLFSIEAVEEPIDHDVFEPNG
eukprot:498920_1